MTARLRRPPLGTASARPASEPRRWRTELSTGTAGRRRCKRSARRRGRAAGPTRPRSPGLPRSGRRRRIRAGHRGTDPGRGHPEGSRDQRTSDQLLDLHWAHPSSLSTVSFPVGAKSCYSHRIYRSPRPRRRRVGGDDATVGSQPEADLKMAGAAWRGSLSAGKPARSRPSGAICPARVAPTRRRRISPARRTRLWWCRDRRRE